MEKKLEVLEGTLQQIVSLTTVTLQRIGNSAFFLSLCDLLKEQSKDLDEIFVTYTKHYEDLHQQTEKLIQGGEKAIANMDFIFETLKGTHLSSEFSEGNESLLEFVDLAAVSGIVDQTKHLIKQAKKSTLALKDAYDNGKKKIVNVSRLVSAVLPCHGVKPIASSLSSLRIRANTLLATLKEATVSSHSHSKSDMESPSIDHSYDSMQSECEEIMDSVSTHIRQIKQLLLASSGLNGELNTATTYIREQLRHHDRARVYVQTVLTQSLTTNIIELNSLAVWYMLYHQSYWVLIFETFRRRLHLAWAYVLAANADHTFATISREEVERRSFYANSYGRYLPPAVAECVEDTAVPSFCVVNKTPLVQENADNDPSNPETNSNQES